MVYKEFIDKILQRIKTKKISLRQVSKYAKIDVSYLSKILAGKRNPPYEENVIIRIAEILDIDTDELIFSAGKIPQKYQQLFSNPEFVKNIFEPIQQQRFAKNKFEKKVVSTKNLEEQKFMPEELL